MAFAMDPKTTGNTYDQISAWWNRQMEQSTTGIDFVRKALALCPNKGSALDVGCGSGGRVITTLLEAGFQVTGIDVSAAQLTFARKRHPNSDFIFADICEWEIETQHDIIIAWDSIFHVPYSQQRPVVGNLCNALAKGGVMLFTAGGVDGEITGEMQGHDFYYSSLTETEYLSVMKDAGCKCVLMERDQHPEEHVVFICVKV